MIPQIQQINFPAYASLTNAVATFAEMGERTISTQIKIDGDIVPDFTGWELSFKGERFVLPVREPQAAKDNTSRRSMVDLVFYSWPIDELKRYFFVEMSSITSGTAIADKYKASLGLNIENFVVAFNQVLTYYFQGKIVMSLFGSGTGIYSPEPSYFEIDNMKIWDVLQKIYEIYEIRWTIEYDSTSDVYTIKVGYPAAEIDDHEFQYGYNGGLLRFERQVQDYDLTNILLGRGGEKNLPYRYFKEVDPNNPDWAGDPDAIPELANIYFENLRDINFRRYVQGWKTNPNRILAEGQQPDPYDSSRGATDFAYAKGHTDPTFNPVEYVKDDASIATYGERWGILDNADDIYPTIQGIEISPYGRIDQVIYVEPVVTDDIEAMAMNAAEVSNLVGAEQSGWLNANDTLTMDIHGADFTVPAGKVGNLTITGSSLGGWFDTVSYGKKSGKQSTINASDPVNALVSVNTTQSYVVAVDKATSQELPLAGLPAGNYYYKVHVVVKGEFETSMYESVSVTAGVSGVKLTISDSDADAWKPTFDIWVKNIWNTTQGGSESDEAYAARVWEPILGDRVGNEASVSFSTGLLSISEDYNFKIASYPVVDRTKTYGGVTSEWRITLIKSDAEYEATGKYIPNADTGGNASAGDYFFFTGIDMPHAYVLWAEEKVNAYKTTELGKLKQINPTWLINIDKVRANTLETGEVEALADRLTCGAKIDISDPRFTNGNTLTLYVQTITYTWQEPSEGNPYIVPDIEVVLSDKVETVTSPIDQLEGDVNLIQASYARVADIESIVRKVAGPLFLKKTGESETSLSPTKFASIVSSDGFRQGDIGGEGWGYYIDGEGHSVLEADILVARKNMRVSSLVVNQVAYLGGKQIISAAALEISKVDTNANGDYVCYFDQKQGSVGNLFVVNDIAMGQVWDAEDTQIRYYKRKVLAVGADYVTLSATIADGTDAPQEGDVLVQYGNYTNTARQYVIIRDVIGGGYERMLSGLSTVSANGTEYYFAGRQSGNSERWFVGNVNGQNASYQNGVLNITGRLSVSTQIDKGNGNYEALSTYLNNLQDQIDGTVQTWYASGVPTLNNYPASSWPTVEDKNNHIGDLYYDKDTGKAYRFMYDGDNEVYVWAPIADEDIAAALALAQQNALAISGLQYLKAATNQGTLVQGGLVLTSMIQLGRTEQSVYKVYSGINGIMDNTATGGGIAAWYGGEMLEKTDWDAMSAADQAQHTYAKTLFRFDGSGYLASGNIKWDASGNGEIPGITWNNGRITLSSSIWLQGGDQLTELIDAVNHMYTQFRYDSDHSIVSVVVSDALYIPTGSPQYPIAGKHAFYNNPNGNYSQTPSGGVANVVKLTLLKNNNASNPLGIYDPGGAQDQTINIPIPTALADLTADSTHRLVTDSQITAWGAKYDKPSGGIPASDLADSYVKQIKLGATGTTYSPTSGLITLPAYPTTARGLDDANDLLFKDTDDTGTDVSIDVETGVTGTVLWGAESNTQVALSVNGATKILLKLAALDGIKSSIATLQGYFTNGSASNALKLGGYAASYFAPASAIPTSVSQLSNDSGYITNSVSDLTNYYLKSETYTKTEVQNLISSGSYTLPIASAGRLGGIRVGSGLSIDSTTGILTATYSYTLPTASSTTKGGIKVGNTLSISNEVLNVLAGNIASNNTGYVTGGDIYSYINAIMSSSMKNIGVSSTAITNGGSETPTINGSPYTPNVNDVVFYDSKEFVWTASGTWRELGDESSFALKTTSISAGTGLTGGGTLSESRTISLSQATQTSLGKADTAVQRAGDTMTGTLNARDILPTTTNTYGLGSSTYKWASAYATTFYGDLSGNASTATNADKLDDVHLNGLLTDFSGGGISSSGNTLTQADHSITVGGVTKTAGSSTASIVNSLSVSSLASNSTTNLSIKITVNGVESDAATITDLYARYASRLLGTSSYTAWGRTFWSNGVPNSISGALESVTDITATGFAQLPNIYASTSLAIPTATPSTSASWYDATRYYLYANPNGNYSQTPSGGGGGGGALLTLTLNGDPFLTYNGSAAVTKNITAVQSSQVKTLTIKVASGDFTGNTFNPLDTANTIINIPQSALTATLNSVYQPLDADLTAIAGLSGTNGFLKKTAADTWTLDTNSYLTTSATLDNVADGTTRKLSDYVPTTRKVNNKALSSDITLSLDDVADGSTRKLSNYVLTTSLNSWAGSQSITTLGTITTGVWNGTAIANNKLALDMSWAFVSNSATYDTTDLITVN